MSILHADDLAIKKFGLQPFGASSLPQLAKHQPSSLPSQIIYRGRDNNQASLLQELTKTCLHNTWPVERLHALHGHRWWTCVQRLSESHHIEGLSLAEISTLWYCYTMHEVGRQISPNRRFLDSQSARQSRQRSSKTRLTEPLEPR